MFYNRWTCNICGCDVFENQHVCEKCKAEAPYIQTHCNHCGRKTRFDLPYCNTCINNLTEIYFGRSVFSYEYPINSLIKKFKYKGAKYLAEFFAEELFELYKRCSEIKSDIVICVPMTEKSLKKRGYNQSELLAVKFSELSAVPFVPSVIEKVRDTKRQATLSRAARILNLKGVYKVAAKTDVKNKTVLLIDDVTTTGTTAEYIAEKLKKKGARVVNVLTVASVSVDNYNMSDVTDLK